MDDLSLSDLIGPIEGTAPVGVDVRSSGPAAETYLTVKDERASARAAEREALSSADPEAEPLAAGLRAWAIVAEGGSALLTHHTKDLQVAAWVVEAWVRTDGLAGLADGLTLLAELVEHYWDEGLHPIDEDDDADGRLAPLFGLFGREDPGTLIQPIKLLPLTDAPGASVALWSVEAVRGQSARHDDPDIRDELVAKRAQRIAEIDAAIAAASPSFVADSLGAIERSLIELDRLMAALDTRTHEGRFGSQVATPLIAIADILRQHHDNLAVVESPVPAVRSEADVSPADRPVSEPPPKQNVMDRPTALATLLEIAGFFDRVEPQSLIGHGLRDLVRRASLPLDDLIAELIPDGDQRAMFLLRAGIRAEQSGTGGGGYTNF